MRSFVVESFSRQNENKAIPLKRFAFDAESRNEKAEFEVFFIHEGKEYQYGFTLDNKKIYEEYLYKKNYKFKNKYTLFERSLNNIKCGGTFKDGEKVVEEVKETLDQEGNHTYRVYSKHKTLSGTGMVEIPFSEESSGTQKIFVLYRFLMDVLRKGTILFIDELDAKLHPLLLRYIINMFIMVILIKIMPS